LGLGRDISRPGVALAAFQEAELVLVVAPARPFARQRCVSITEVGTEQLILFDRTSSYYEVTQNAFMAAGVTLRGLMELDNIEAAKKMVERGLGVSLLPRSAVGREAGAGLLALVELTDAAPMRRQIVAMRRRD